MRRLHKSCAFCTVAQRTARTARSWLRALTLTDSWWAELHSNRSLPKLSTPKTKFGQFNFRSQSSLINDAHDKHLNHTISVFWLSKSSQKPLHSKCLALLLVNTQQQAFQILGNGHHCSHRFLFVAKSYS